MPEMNAQTLIVDGVHSETKTFDFSPPSASDLTESAIFFGKEGVAYDASGAALPFSFLSMPRQHLEAELKTTVQEIFESRREGAVSLHQHAYIPGLIPGYWNYYHLLIDCLPRVLLSLQTDCTNPRILVTRFQATRLQRAHGDLWAQLGGIFGFRESVEVVEGDLLYVERSIVPTTRFRFVGATPQRFQDVASRISKTGAQRRIYVSRKLATARRVFNEDEVTATLHEFRFQTVLLEQMSLKEQIKLFRESHVIAGPHGAGLANIVFSEPETILVEFLHETGLYKVPIFSELSGMIAGKHVVLRSKPETNSQHPGHAGNMDMSVDCVALRTTLKSLLG